MRFRQSYYRYYILPSINIDWLISFDSYCRISFRCWLGRERRLFSREACHEGPTLSERVLMAHADIEDGDDAFRYYDTSTLDISFAARGYAFTVASLPLSLFQLYRPLASHTATVVKCLISIRQCLTHDFCANASPGDHFIMAVDDSSWVIYYRLAGMHRI